jgi:short-subunit dehydrogenase
MELRGRTALVTGATGGLGTAIARALAARGAVPVVTGRRADALEPLAAETGGRAIAADLSSAADVDRLLAEAGDVDVLVANAGLGAQGRVDDFCEADVERVIRVNLEAPVRTARALAPAMRARGSGQMVFVSSLAGKAASGGTSLYNATKFGLRGFSFAMHEDLRGSGVGATAVFPGAVADAGMWADGGLDLPPGVKPSKPSAVADAVIEGIEKDKPEISVGNPIERLGGLLFGPAPRVVSFINRHGPTNKLAAELAERQVEKR